VGLGVSLLAATALTGTTTNLYKVAPWGRFLPLRKDIDAASKAEAEGGTGVGLQFWNWTEEQVKLYS
jgi:hypothetical protein